MAPKYSQLSNSSNCSLFMYQLVICPALARNGSNHARAHICVRVRVCACACARVCVRVCACVRVRVGVVVRFNGTCIEKQNVVLHSHHT